MLRLSTLLALATIALTKAAFADAAALSAKNNGGDEAIAARAREIGLGKSGEQALRGALGNHGNRCAEKGDHYRAVDYSTRDGDVAADDVGGANNPFARAFLDDLLDATRHRRLAFTYGSLPVRKDFNVVAAK